MTNSGIAKSIEKDQAKADMKAADLKAFNPGEFDTHKDAFCNFLSQTTSVTRKCSLLYIVHPSVSPFIFIDDFEDSMFQMSFTGQEYNLDHRTLYAKLKAFLIGIAGYACIELYNHATNGRTTFQVWVGHYNGAGELNKRTALDKVRMRELHYKNKQSMLFEKYTEMIIKCFSTLDKDECEKLSGEQKFNAIINCIIFQYVHIMAATLYVSGKYLHDVNMVRAYVSREVAQIHSSAQVDVQTSRRKAVTSTQQTVVVAAEVVLVTVDVDAEEDMEGLMGEAAEVVAGVIEIAEEYPASTALIYRTPLAHLPTKNGPCLVQAVVKPMSLNNA